MRIFCRSTPRASKLLEEQQVTRGASYSRSSSALPEEHAEHAAGHVHDMAILRIVAVRSSSSEMMLHRGLEAGMAMTGSVIHEHRLARTMPSSQTHFG